MMHAQTDRQTRLPLLGLLSEPKIEGIVTLASFQRGETNLTLEVVINEQETELKYDIYVTALALAAYHRFKIHKYKY